MKYFILLLGLTLCAPLYVRVQQPKTWNDCLSALKVPDDPIDASPGSPALVSTPVSASAPPVVPPPPDSHPVVQVVTPDSSFAYSDHVREVQQPVQTSDVPTGPITNGDAPPPVKEFVPPNPLPAQPNWTWNVQGKDYCNVVITQVEADRVHITYEGGAGTINTSDLTPELQKALNYDPQLSAQVAKARSDQQAKYDAQEAPKIAEWKAQQAQQAAMYENQRVASEQADSAQQRVTDAQEQKRHYEDDMRQMVDAREIRVYFDPKTGSETIWGTNYWQDKYHADEQAVGACDRIINSGGR